MQAKCPKCGTLVDVNDNYCINCGFKLDNQKTGTASTSSGSLIMFVVIFVVALVMLFSIIMAINNIPRGNTNENANSTDGFNQKNTEMIDDIVGIGDEVDSEAKSDSEQRSKEDYDTKESLAVSTHDETTPIGNLINGGYTASGDGWVFYAIPGKREGWNTVAIGRMHMDGTDSKIIYRSPDVRSLIWHLNYADGRLYFNEDIDNKNFIVSVDSNGNDRQTISNCIDGTLCQVYDNALYWMSADGLTATDLNSNEAWKYQFTSDDRLWRIWSPDGKRTQSHDELALSFKQGTSTIYSIKWSENTKSENVFASFTPNKVINVCPDNKLIWVLLDTNSDDKGDLIISLTDKGNKTGTSFNTSGPAIRINVNQFGIFLVIEQDGSMRIERMTKDGTSVEIYYQAKGGETVLYPSVQGDYLFFGLPDSKQIASIPIDSPGITPKILGD